MNKLRILIISVLFFLFSGLVSTTVEAQCPMCKATAESAINNDKDNTVGLGLNDGILYLLAAPYLMVGSVGFIWYWNGRKRKKAEPNS